MDKRNREYLKKYRQQRLRKYRREYMKDYYHRWRAAVLERIGDSKCARCGFDDPRALQIDHVNGGGTKRERRWDCTYWRRLALAPDEEIVGVYQILCANCNFIKMVENHETGGASRRN